MEFNYKQSAEYQKELVQIFEKGLPPFNEHLAILKASQNDYNRQRERFMIQERKKIENCEEFILYLQYKEKRYNGLYLEEIKLNGIKNAKMISQRYREIGHQIGLYRLSLKAIIEGKEQKIIGVKFK